MRFPRFLTHGANYEFYIKERPLRPLLSGMTFDIINVCSIRSIDLYYRIIMWHLLFYFTAGLLSSIIKREGRDL